MVSVKSDSEKEKVEKLGNSTGLYQELTDIVKSINSIKKTNQNYNSYIFDSIRQQLVDWLIIVSNKLALKDQTYILAIGIFDDVLEKLEGVINEDIKELQLYAIISLMVSTKYEEIDYIDLKVASKFLGHQHFTREEIKEKELYLLSLLKYKLKFNHFVEFAHLVHVLFDDNNVKQNPKLVLSPKLDLCFRTSVLIYKIILQNYKFYRSKDETCLYFSIVFFSLNHLIKKKSILKSPFKSDEEFFSLSDSFNLDKRVILIMCNELQFEILSFLKRKDRECNYLYKLDIINYL